MAGPFYAKTKKKKICWLLSFFFPLFFFYKLILPGFYIILRETPAIVELLLTYRHPLHQLLNLPVLRKKAFWFNSYIDYTGISTRQPKEKKKKRKKKKKFKTKNHYPPSSERDIYTFGCFEISISSIIFSRDNKFSHRHIPIKKCYY